MTDLEERLATLDGGALRDALMERITALEIATRMTLRRGLEPAAFLDCQSLTNAATAARQVLAQWICLSGQPDGTSPPRLSLSSTFPGTSSQGGHHAIK